MATPLNMTLNHYIQLVERMYRTAQGNNLARLVSLQDQHVKNKNLHSSDIAVLVEGNCVAPLDEIVIAHLLCVKALRVLDYTDAHAHQSAVVNAVIKLINSQKLENWCLPLMYTVCLDLRLVAKKADDLAGKQNKGKILEKAAENLLACFRVCAADNRSSDADTKRIGMLGLVNQLLKLYFRINKIQLCKPLIRAIDSSPLKEHFPLPHQVTYKYYVGRKAIFDSDFRLANEYLTYAFTRCHSSCVRNKRLILTYLVPVKMLLGYMPTEAVLRKYDLVPFWELVVALKAGNIQGIDNVIANHESFLMDAGIYLIVEKLKILAYRNLFRRVYLFENNHLIDINKFQVALHAMGQTHMDLDETQCLVANLIYEGKIKGYISFQHKKLVVSKQNPFPPLTTMEYNSN